MENQTHKLFSNNSLTFVDMTEDVAYKIKHEGHKCLKVNKHFRNNELFQNNFFVFKNDSNVLENEEMNQVEPSESTSGNFSFTFISDKQSSKKRKLKPSTVRTDSLKKRKKRNSINAKEQSTEEIDRKGPRANSLDPTSPIQTNYVPLQEGNIEDMVLSTDEGIIYSLLFQLPEENNIESITQGDDLNFNEIESFFGDFSLVSELIQANESPHSISFMFEEIEEKKDEAWSIVAIDQEEEVTCNHSFSLLFENIGNGL